MTNRTRCYPQGLRRPVALGALALRVLRERARERERERERECEREREGERERERDAARLRRDLA